MLITLESPSSSKYFLLAAELSSKYSATNFEAKKGINSALNYEPTQESGNFHKMIYFERYLNVTRFAARPKCHFLIYCGGRFLDSKVKI